MEPIRIRRLGHESLDRVALMVREFGNTTVVVMEMASQDTKSIVDVFCCQWRVLVARCGLVWHSQ